MSDKSLEELGINVRQQTEPDERLDDLRQRAARCVCRYCGQKLSLRKITYAAYDEAKIELFCEQCDRIEYGVEPEIYQVAKYFVDELGYDHYPNIDESLRKTRMNFAVICDIIAWGFKNTGLLQSNGFTVPLDLEAGVLGEATLLSDTALRQLKEE